MTYEEWADQYPAAAAALATVFNQQPDPRPAVPLSEAAVQQQVRLEVARQGALAWRNNVGATKSRCPDCGARQSVTRYGLANDSTALNQKMKSSDLILAIPRTIRPEDVGRTIAQFGSVECKPVGWQYTGNGREAGQAAWLGLISKVGGYATFSTGKIVL